MTRQLEGTSGDSEGGSLAAASTPPCRRVHVQQEHGT